MFTGASPPPKRPPLLFPLVRASARHVSSSPGDLTRPGAPHDRTIPGVTAPGMAAKSESRPEPPASAGAGAPVEPRPAARGGPRPSRGQDNEKVRKRGATENLQLALTRGAARRGAIQDRVAGQGRLGFHSAAPHCRHTPPTAPPPGRAK